MMTHNQPIDDFDPDASSQRDRRPTDSNASNRGFSSNCVQRVLDRLDGVRSSGSNWTAPCPAHDDRSPSLSISAGDDGRALLYCHAGCSLQSVLEAIDLEVRDLFPYALPNRIPNGTTPIQNAYPYRGNGFFGLITRHPGDRPGEKTFRSWSRDGERWTLGLNGLTLPLYNLAAVERAAPDVPILVVEGEKDVDTLTAHGFTATTNAGGAKNWRAHHATALAVRRIVVIPHNDQAGRSRTELVARTCHEAGCAVQVVSLDVPAKGDVTDWFAAGATADDLRGLIEAAPVWQPPHGSLEETRVPSQEPGWPVPVPLDDLPRPPFPLSALPLCLRSIVEALAEETQTPPDLAATVILGTLSAAAGGKYVVRPDPWWTEQTNLMLVTALDSGNRKSAALRTAIAPISAWERAQASTDRRALARWRADRKVKEATLKRLQHSAASPDIPGKTKPANLSYEIDALAEELATDREPSITQVIADDATPEHTMQLLYQQGGAIAIMSAEGAWFSNLSGRYSESPNLDVALSGHAGDPIRVDRIGRVGEYIPRPALTVCVTPQRQVLRDLGDVPGFRERGLAARILPSLPPSYLGFRSVRPAQMPDKVLGSWAQIVTGILDLPGSPDRDEDGYQHPISLTLSPDARDVLYAFQEWVERELRQGGLLGEITDWGSKLPGAVVRLAGNLHIAVSVAERTLPESTPIPTELLQLAIELGHYYLGHALATFDLFGERSDLNAAREVLRVLRVLCADRRSALADGTLNPLVTRRDLYLRLKDRKRFPKADALAAPLALLEELGYVRTWKETTEHGGRPSVKIELSPRAQNPQYPQNPRLGTSVDGSGHEDGAVG